MNFFWWDPVIFIKTRQVCLRVFCRNFQEKTPCYTCHAWMRSDEKKSIKTKQYTVGKIGHFQDKKIWIFQHFLTFEKFQFEFPESYRLPQNSNKVTFRVVFKRVLKEVWHKVLKFPIRLGKYERTFEIVEDLQVDQSHANEGNNILHGHRENGVIDSLFRFATLFFWATPIFHAINDVGPRRVEFGVMDSRVEENGGGHQHGNN